MPTTSPSCRSSPRERSTSIYIDPPFNTGRAQTRRSLQRPCATRTATGWAFRGRAIAPSGSPALAFADRFDDYLAFLEPRLRRGAPRARAERQLYFHIDYREVHYCKVLLDGIFGRERSSTRSSGPTTTARAPRSAGRPSTTTSSSTPRTPSAITSTSPRIDRIPYMAPGLVGPGEGGARQAAHRHLVAHHRQPDRQGEDRLSDAEAARRPAPDRRGLVEPGRPGARLLRRQRHHRARPRWSWAATSCWSIHNPEAIDVMRERFAHNPDVTFE